MRIHEEKGSQSTLTWGDKEVLFSYGIPVAAEDRTTGTSVFLAETTKTSNMHICAWKREKAERSSAQPKTLEEIDQFLQGWINNPIPQNGTPAPSNAEAEFESPHP